MPFNAEQRAKIERRLPVGRVDGMADEVVQVGLKRRELAFILNAIAHFRDACCTDEVANADCSLMYWFETPEGHLGRACELFCQQLIDGTLAQVPEVK